MSSLKKINIGLIASLTGNIAQIGCGYRDSAIFILERKQAEFNKQGIYLNLIEKDDKSDPDNIENLACECVNEDCVAIFGPNDTFAMQKLLASQRCLDLPILSTIATASFLSEIGTDNFFRFTTPDHVRAEILVRYVRSIYPEKTIYLYSLQGSRMSYAQQLKNDVINSLEKYSCKWCAEEFSEDSIPNNLPKENQPVIICSLSSNTAKFADKLRKNNVTSQVFTFGSNTNLLTNSLLRTIVVCDLDRNDSNPLSRDELDHFSERYRNTSDPSLSTMNAMTALLNLIFDILDNSEDIEIPQVRYELVNYFKSKPLRGLIGPVAFSDNGEMAGHEQISVLRVTKSRFGFRFKHLKRDEKPLKLENQRFSKTLILILTIIGSLASIISLFVVFN